MKRSIATSAKMTMYTFGSPRTGNQAFSNYVMSLFPNGGYQRVTHYNDIVPHVPPTEFGFNHAGNEAWQMNSGDDLTMKFCTNNAGNAEN